MQEYGSGRFRGMSTHGRRRFSTDGRTVLQNLGRLQAVDVETGEVVTGAKVGAFVPVGGHVVAVNGSALEVYRAAGLEPVRTVEVGVTLGLDRRPCLAAGGGLVAALANDDGAGTLAVVDTGTWQVRLVGLDAVPSCVAVADDGSVVAVGTDLGNGGRVLLVDPATGTVTATLTGPRAPVTGVAVRGDRVVAAAGARALAWELPPPGRKKAPKATVLLAAKKPASLVGVTSAGTAVVHAEKLFGVDAVTGQTAWESAWVSGAMLCGDRLVVDRYRTVVELDPATGAELRRWETPAYAWLAAVASDRIAVEFHARVEVLGDCDTWPSAFDGHMAAVRSASFDGERFATGGHDQQAFVWVRKRPQPLFGVLGSEHDREGAVYLAGDDLYTGFGHGVQRWHVDGTHEASVDGLKSTPTLIRRLPNGLVIVATKVSRSRYGELYLLDGKTLSVLDNGRIGMDLLYADIVDDRHVRAYGARLDITYDFAARQRVSETDHGRPALGDASYLLPSRGILVETGRWWPAGGSSGQWISVYDLSARDFRHRRLVTEPIVGRAALSPTGLLATPHADAVRVWDLDTGSVLRELATELVPESLRWFPDGTALLASAVNGALHELPV
ncbi:PQQ-binding-like beta-propeller repeat protein [Virgisporangium ochraceum]|uniref:WD40 repeat domain-containing protein n=1 Tax=Virgisporangium ochraceum TaxID=65505 RepID=A0A8J3ZXI8_9ACTN|nr:PQQ-binding-like beta-propeller repeat protein [Virgisporangium ochraceum]GIJ71446.1 hypothetical protein Voc01_063630 [Virgisporangium ochraceum]